MRKTIGLLVVIFFTAVLIVNGGMAVSPAAAETVTVRFSTWNVMEGTTKQVTEELVRRFEKANPNVKVEFIGIPYEQMLQQTLVAVAGGDQADLMHLVAQWAPPLAHMGALEPLDGYFSSAELDDMPKAAVEAGIIKGKVMSVPWVLGSIVVFGWKDVLQKAGLPLKIPETWPEFKEAVAKVSAIGDEYYGFGARTSKDANSAFWFFPVMWGHGGEFEDASGKIVFNNPGTLAALDWYKELGQEKYSPAGMDVREVRNLMGMGKLGFVFDGPWMKGIFRNITGKGKAIDDAYVYGMFPKSADGKRYGIGNNHVFCVSSKSKVKKEAVALVKYITQNEECVRLFYDVFGGMPIYKKFLKDPYYGNDPWIRTFLGSAEFANSVPSKNPTFSAALEEVAVAMQQALLGRDTKKAAATAEKNIKKIYKQK